MGLKLLKQSAMACFLKRKFLSGQNFRVPKLFLGNQNISFRPPKMQLKIVVQISKIVILERVGGRWVGLGKSDVRYLPFLALLIS